MSHAVPQDFKMLRQGDRGQVAEAASGGEYAPTFGQPFDHLGVDSAIELFQGRIDTLGQNQTGSIEQVNLEPG
jgi:hypothetical protein